MRRSWVIFSLETLEQFRDSGILFFSAKENDELFRLVITMEFM